MTTSTTPSYTHHTDIGFVYRTSPANGIQDEIEDERALRAADDIETGVPPAGDYENTAIMHAYIHTEQSDVPTTSRTTEGRQRKRRRRAAGAARAEQSGQMLRAELERSRAESRAQQRVSRVGRAEL